MDIEALLCAYIIALFAFSYYVYLQDFILIAIQSHPVIMSTVTSPIVKSPTLSSGSTEVHSTRSENVQVQSVVQCETHSKFHTEHNKKIEDLMARLGKFKIQIEMI